MESALFLLVGMGIGFLVCRLLFRQGNSQTPSPELTQAREDMSRFLNEEKGRLEDRIGQLQQDLVQINRDWIASKTALEHAETRLKEQKAEFENLNQRFKVEFEVLANRILEEKSQKFTDHNRVSMDTILSPLKEKIKDFEEKVQKVYDLEAAERNTLKGEIKQLINLNQVMHQEAQNLTKALKGDTKTQGNWGEFILEKILEKSGLVKDREYLTQASVTTEDGRRLQPDVVILLPDGKNLIIDSKVSLVAYERLVSAEAEDLRALAIKEHVQSFRNHIKNLSDKNYHKLYGLNSLDFVLLFVPVEPAFAVVMQHDPNLFNDAFEKNIVLVSPSTLLATLRTVANIWRQEQQNRNAFEIAKKAGDLYDKFNGFVEDLVDIGKKMDQSKTSYSEAMKKLSTGRGNLINRVEELKKMGATTQKSIRQDLLDRADSDSLLE